MHVVIVVFRHTASPWRMKLIVNYLNIQWKFPFVIGIEIMMCLFANHKYVPSIAGRLTDYCNVYFEEEKKNIITYILTYLLTYSTEQSPS